MPQPNKPSQADLLSKWKQRRKPVDRTIPARPAGTVVAPTSGQQRLWLLQQLYPDNAFYQYGHLYKFSGPLEADLLEQSLAQIVERHELLRSNYVRPEEDIQLIIRPAGDFRMARIDLDSVPIKERRAKSEATALAEAQKPFDLATGPLFRATLIYLGEETSWLVISMHHIIGDRSSLMVLNEELFGIYTELAEGRSNERSPLAIQFPDYAHWKNQRPVADKSLQYWTDLLGEAPPSSALPFDQVRAAKPTYAGATLTTTVSSETSVQVRELARDVGTTNNVVFLAAYQSLLLRYGAQKDLTVGSPVSTRDRTELEGMVGFLNETVVLRTRFEDKDERFRDLVARTKTQMEQALEHKDVPFDVLVNHLQPRREPGANPLFQNMLVYNTEAAAPTLPKGLELGEEMMDLGVAKFDLTLFATDHGNHFTLALEYAKDLFDEATAQRMLAHLTVLLEHGTGQPDTPVTQLELMSPAERQKVLLDWNDTATKLPRPASVTELILAAGQENPTAIAVADEEHQLSYQALIGRSAALAGELQRAGVLPGTPVGLFVGRTVDLIVGILGILRAGGAYVPLDPDYPAGRTAYIIEDAGIEVVVTTKNLRPKLVDSGLRTVDVPMAPATEAPLFPTLSGDDPAYLIYTSGSTGKPKGVTISQANLVHSTTARFAYFEHQPKAFLLLSSFAFDSSVAGIFWTLCKGGKLVIPPKRIEQDMARLRGIIHHQGITHTLLLPSLYQLLLEEATPDELASLQTVMVAGEACSPVLVRTHFKHFPSVELVNEYGPTEGTVWCTAHKIQPGDANGAVPIGKPIPNVKNYVLDAHLQPVPLGVPGELYLAGEGLAKGYWQQPSLTQERFLEADLGAVAGAGKRLKARLYKTGDLVKLRPSGLLDFLGRADHQVKIRGFRVELEEVSRRLEQVPAVREAVTIVDQSGAVPRLAAYYTVREQLSALSLRQSLLADLPEYMVPAILIALDELPRLPNGKINQSALPAPELTMPATSAETFVAPATDTEKSLAAVWEKVLKRGPVGLDDNYFAIGGDSIRSIRIISQARKEGLELEPHHIFTHQTVRELAAALDQKVVDEEARTVVPLRRTGSEAPLFCIHAGGGHVFFYQPLSNALPQHRPVYAVQPHTLAGMDDLPEDIPAMAADYLREIRKVQPHGPYHLLGTCFSNCVVLETAHQLLAAGETVGSLFIIDSSPTQLAPVPVPRFSPVYTMIRIIREANWKLLRRSIYRYWFHTRQALSIPLEDKQGKALRQTINGLYQRYNEYTWSPIQHPITLIRSAQFAENPEKKYHEDNWSTLAGGGLVVRAIPGTHIGLFEPPYVEQLAATIEKCLQETPAATAP
ncbi:non-ribosomal peptide synthetase [Neolewinella persica]|uniref:non-ribosomal peptide synthetase n=1 Tax=Neolewinella persica TaxID=70998 RepID=UPI0003A1A692|nr:non-ribosomal peptide synthetase [Neolewinella persica]